MCRTGGLTLIHGTAIVDPSAQLGENVEIGPYSIIGADVVIGPGNKIGPHVVIQGPTSIGADNTFYQFASIGEAPQDKKYAAEPTRLEIGDRNVIREFCTINRGTIQDAGVTRIGHDNWIMAYVHIAHDCSIGNHTVFANSATLAGHVTVEDYAILGGFTLVHQFCTVGARCFTAMNSVISKDVPPFMMVSGHMAKPYGLNTEGLKRAGFSSDDINQLRRVYKILYRSGNTLEQAITVLKDMENANVHTRQLAEFLGKSKRGIIR